MGRENTTQPGFGTVAKPHDSERDSELPTGSRRVDASGLPQAPAELLEAPAPDTPAPPAQRRRDTPALQSGRKPKVQTQRGLTSSKPPKLVTKHGLAPPPPTSTPPPPPPDDPNWKPERIPTASQLPKIDLSDDSGWVPDYAAIQAARDEKTPTAPEVTMNENPAPEPDGSARAQFRTNRGGGKNRLSGGRSAASAYVSPSTLAPGHGHGHHTAAVKIHSSVLVDSQRYHTEPSLLRRRQSTAPVAPPRRKRPHVAWILLLSLVGGFGSGLLVLAYHSAPTPPSPAGAETASETDVPADALAAPPLAQDEKSESSRNAAPGSPNPLAERGSDAPSPSIPAPAVKDASASPPSPPTVSSPSRPPRPAATRPDQPQPAAPSAPPKPTTTRPAQSKASPSSPAPESTPTYRIVPQSDSSSDELWLE